jgi:5-methylcytosine-specific restriction endonuclease McrA
LTPRGDEETRAVPKAIRELVHERDGLKCRLCGRHDENVCLHHIEFRSQGGLHVVENLVSLGWSPWHDCHLQLAHGPHARMWRPLLQEVVHRPGVTAMQLRRWSRQ